MPKPHTDIRTVRWETPTPPALKLNTDGSSYGNPGRAGFGGLLRDHRGAWMIGYSSSCGNTTCLKAELLGILYGLKTAWDYGARHIICESDSTIALKLIKERNNSFHPHFPLTELIHSLTTLDWNISFKHVLREGNSCADWLAKQGAQSSDGIKFWHHSPPQLSSAMLPDSMGVLHPRSS